MCDIIAKAALGIAKSAVNISIRHYFDSDISRDAYFTGNPLELKEKMYILNDNQLQQYINEQWVNASMVVKGACGSSIIGAEFDNDNINFTKDDNSIVVLENAKEELKGEPGASDYNDLTNKPIIPGEYTLPTASTTVKGGVKIDGTTITIDNEIISAVGGGSGDVVGPIESVNDNIATFDGITGKIIQDGGAKVSDFLTSETDPVYEAEKENYKILSGFENRTDSTISITGSTFTITGNYNIWINQVGKVNITEAKSVEITSDQQLSYIYFDYFDNDVRLNISTSAWDFRLGNIVPIALVFKDDTIYALSDERHGHNRDLEWHYWAHLNIGAMYYDGLTGTFTDTTLSIIQGTIFDEDIEFNTGGTKTLTSLWYRGEAGPPDKMRVVRGSTRPYSYIGNNAQWDNGSGTLQEVGNNNYYVSWVYATNDPTEPIYTVIGQGNHANLNNARGEAQPIINLTTAEWKLLYKVIYRNTTIPTKIEEQDFRNVQTGVPVQAVSPTSHSILTDRDAINSHPATAISYNPGGEEPLTTVQSEIDTLKEAMLTVPTLTTEERDALTPSNGMLIYNTTTNKFQGYENGVWVDLI